MKKSVCVACVFVLLVACGGGGGSTPTAPTTTTPATPANRAPQISSLNFAPTFGIAQLTRFDFNASATDPDGDSLSYAWSVAGNPFSGTSGSITFSGPGSSTATLTVTDSKGATATDSRTFVVGGMTGTWTGSFSSFIFTSRLVQTGTAITGDYSDQLGAGKLDPAVANTIDAAGNIRLRYKQAIFSDFTFTGTINSTGRTATGVVNGSGFVNTPFTMTRQ